MHPVDPGQPQPPSPHPALEQTPSQPEDAAASRGLGSLPGLAVASVACFALGWLGYQLVSRLGPQPPAPLAEQALTPSSAAGSAVAPGAPPPSAAGAPPLGNSSLGKRISGSAAGTVDQEARLTALQCLAGGQAEVAAPADPSNYGPRQAVDWQGRPVANTPALIVLHETVVDEGAALNLFARRNGDDGQQASYHVLIGRDGRRIRVVEDSQRAFGAGDSAFEGMSVQLKRGLRPSINNIALHVSLVSPADGADGDAGRHSGYTAAQYRSLASQIGQWQARWGIPASRVVTHQEVDRSGSRRDPRSFDWGRLGRDLSRQWIACGGSAQLADLRR